MNIETQAKMIDVIRNSFDINLSIVAELLHCERRDVADVFYKGKCGGLDTEKLLYLFVQAKCFSQMNYIRPDCMFMRPVLCCPSCKSTLLSGGQLNRWALQQLKVFDTLEAETRARGQGGKPFRSAREAADEISTPYFGESYEG